MGETFRQSMGWLHIRVGLLVGWALLVLALVPAVAVKGPTVGIVTWIGLVTPAALTVALMLSCRDYWWRA